MTFRRTLLSAILGLAVASLAWGYRTKQQPSAQPSHQLLDSPRQSVLPIGVPVQIKAPLGLPRVPVPKDNPPTAETIALGRRLYYDPRLSADNTVACATCHNPKFGFTDGQPVSTGIRGQKGGRSAPSVFNAAYYTVQFWDGRAPSLEKQAEGPVQNPIEMGHTLEGAVKKLAADPSYRAAFERAFGRAPITYQMVAKSIASFERTVISGNSPFDRYFYGGDKKALSKAARRGLEVFRNPKKGNCATCHTIGEKHALFADNKFHNLGVGAISLPDRVELGDLGRYQASKKNTDRGAFKTLSLRNVALTGPYMHDGSLKTLKDVVDFYVGGGNSNPYRDPKIKSLDFLTGQEREDLVAFMESLTGEIPSNVGPPKPKPLQTRK